jgi:hypothetical protein
VDTGLIEFALVQRNPLIGVGHRVLQALELQGLQLVAGHGFFAVQDGIAGS